MKSIKTDKNNKENLKQDKIEETNCDDNTNISKMHEESNSKVFEQFEQESSNFQNHINKFENNINNDFEQINNVIDTLIIDNNNNKFQSSMKVFCNCGSELTCKFEREMGLCEDCCTK